MSTTFETALRSLGIVILIGILGWVEQSSNLTAAIGGNWAGILASIAAVAVAVVDKYYSPDGTVLAGTIGVRK